MFHILLTFFISSFHSVTQVQFQPSLYLTLSLEQKCLNVFKIASINTFIFYSVSDNFMLGERVHTGQTRKNCQVILIVLVCMPSI